MAERHLDQLSRIGGAAQGGSSKTPQEREALEREQRHSSEENPAGAGEDPRVTPPEPERERRPDDQSRGSSTS